MIHRDRIGEPALEIRDNHQYVFEIIEQLMDIQ